LGKESIFNYEYLLEFEFKIENVSVIMKGTHAEPIVLKNEKSISLVRGFLLMKMFGAGLFQYN
jgi:hypothetical protein